MKEIKGLLKTHPAVFSVGRDYQIMVPVKEKCIMWVEVDGVRYYDSSNGINRSETPVHRMMLPMAVLDKAKKYTLGYRKIINRKPYFPELEDEVCVDYGFRPIESENINIYHISDTHNLIKSPVEAGQYFDNKGEALDLLVLNGDIPDHSGTVENFDTVYEIVSRLTQGGIPTVFSRGNHDLRGLCAEAFADYTPSDKGASYYTLRVGPIWAILLDCGEDKPDTNAEYGGTIDCHSFRLAQTDFLKKVIENAKDEYEADGVKYKLVISHVPFSHKLEPPFDIEPEIYTEWCKLLGESVKPDLMISGHLHRCFTAMPGSGFDTYGQPCPVIVGSTLIRPNKEKDIDEGFVGCALTLEKKSAKVVFNKNDGTISGEEAISL